MPEYLSKEEIRQWRSSLEKITLEEFAARLGKTINEEKETRDIVDIVLEKEPVLVHENYRVKTEKITSIAQRAFAKEKEITTVKHITKSETKTRLEKPIVKETKPAKTAVPKTKPEKTAKVAKSAPAAIKVETTSSKDVKVTFKKPLTEREQMVFNHFLENILL